MKSGDIRNIHTDKAHGYPLSLHAKQFLFRYKEVYHSTKNHVVESIYPQRCEGQENKGDLGEG